VLCVLGPGGRGRQAEAGGPDPLRVEAGQPAGRDDLPDQGQRTAVAVEEQRRGQDRGPAYRAGDRYRALHPGDAQAVQGPAEGDPGPARGVHVPAGPDAQRRAGRPVYPPGYHGGDDVGDDRAAGPGEPARPQVHGARVSHAEQPPLRGGQPAGRPRGDLRRQGTAGQQAQNAGGAAGLDRSASGRGEHARGLRRCPAHRPARTAAASSASPAAVTSSPAHASVTDWP
jgi:hypothetical protein